MTLRFSGRIHPALRRRLRPFAVKLVRVLRLGSAARGGEICVAFVPDRDIRRLNRRFLRHAGSTDVIAFNYSRPRGRVRGPAPFGDVYVCVDAARRQARSRGHALVQELALLVLHGFLHLLGHEDSTPALKKKMFSRQAAVFRKVDPRLAPPDVFLI
ncbi:MAG: rRNA maturation RNase YbeY [Elusimicrobia bacterium RIFCSPLOWO2_01_FULL_64_13]|nr:MAG: rRNA maturation RNase YbeY [Elusimicrobia bacterium RIFCSPHIGHO2_01_FULL_64_10]OGR94489.1 MAG: rRNA maturation RNase YbeY [Elusimicrobia bacterium RIFCSPLOWO2_01_FULL_64_13]